MAPVRPASLKVRALQWLAQRGGVRARACSELEWERAARGADWRPLPMGFKPDDAHRHADWHSNWHTHRHPYRHSHRHTHRHPDWHSNWDPHRYSDLDDH